MALPQVDPTPVAGLVTGPAPQEFILIELAGKALTSLITLDVAVDDPCVKVRLGLTGKDFLDRRVSNALVGDRENTGVTRKGLLFKYDRFQSTSHKKDFWIENIIW